LTVFSLRLRWIYVIVFIPAITEWIETGHLPQTPRESLSEFILGSILLAAAWLICRQGDRIATMAETDALTGLLNARRFQRDLRAEVERAGRQRTSLCLGYLDLDGFKEVNDAHGHLAGDELLRRFGETLSGEVRRHVDRGYRVGGDEFAVLLPGTRAGEAREVVERIRRKALPELRALGASVSGGIVELAASEEAQTFLRRADRLLYAAKAGGKDRVLI
jgi:diguanylate cyclase (GGDEF)-like protein